MRDFKLLRSALLVSHRAARIQFQEIPDARASATERRMAGQALGLCVRDLGLGDVRLRWLLAQWWGEDGVRGFVHPDEPGSIFVTAGQPLKGLPQAVAHECRHLWQARRYGSWRGWWDDCDTPTHRAAQESDATAYAERFVREFG